MKVHLSFVPPGGGETDYTLLMEMPEIPKAGDYISVFRPEEQGTSDFIVKRAWWNMEFNEGAESGSTKSIWVECEFALKRGVSSESHKRCCESYHVKTGTLLEFDESMY